MVPSDQYRRRSTSRLARETSSLESCRVNKEFNGPRGRFGMTRKYLEFHRYVLPSSPSWSSLFARAALFRFFSFVRGTATWSRSSSSNGSGGSDEEGGRRLVKLIVLVVSGGRITSLDQPGRIVPRMKWTRKVFIERGIRFGNEIRNSFSSSRKNLILRFSWTSTILARVSLGWNDRNFTESKEKSNY